VFSAIVLLLTVSVPLLRMPPPLSMPPPKPKRAVLGDDAVGNGERASVVDGAVLEGSVIPKNVLPLTEPLPLVAPPVWAPLLKNVLSWTMTFPAIAPHPDSGRHGLALLLGALSSHACYAPSACTRASYRLT
jgi:hypothetical protein